VVQRFSGKAAVVTGAAHGIGRAIAERLAAEGAAVLLVDIDAAAAAAAAAEIATAGGEAEGISADIANRDDVRRAVARCVERFGGVDVLAANAGIADAQPFAEIDEARWRRVIDVNLTGTFFCMQEAARVMIPARRGAIVATASTNAFWVESNMAPYNASKGAIVALVKSAAFDLGRYGIRVNAVAPGMVRTRANPVTEDPVGGRAGRDGGGGRLPRLRRRLLRQRRAARRRRRDDDRHPPAAPGRALPGDGRSRRTGANRHGIRVITGLIRLGGAPPSPTPGKPTLHARLPSPAHRERGWGCGLPGESDRG
jgi:NAD(P)-dependent dehydrogenase (short-subunit alcohol dehydrogenase family)